MNTKLFSPASLRGFAAALLLLLSPATRQASADVVTDWNVALESTLILPPANPNERGPAVPVRVYAIMHAAMFDAVNGITRRYEPLHVTATPPPLCNPEAAAIQAAYVTLTALRSGNQAVWDTQLATSLAALPGGTGLPESIARGRQWGTTVASAILTWRTGDAGTPPPYAGNPAIGFWKHPSNPATTQAGYTLLATTPFVLTDPLAFDPGPPYGFASRADVLANAGYAADVNEVMARGGATSSVRTPSEEFEALFLHAADQASMNQLLRSIIPPGASLVDNARLFALFNISCYDAQIAIFRTKYKHEFWRPFQAVNNADLDNNPATTKPATVWAPLRPTPPHPEYPSAHVTLFTTMLRIAQRLVGDDHEVALTAPGYATPLVYSSMAAISDATVDARVNIGNHFRQTGEVSQVFANAIADYVVDHAMRPVTSSRMVNLSVRGMANGGAEALIAGFVITDAPKQVLIRGIGPGLQSVGVRYSHTDPRIILFSGSGAVIASNDNWGSSGPEEAALLTLAFKQAGAFPIQPGSSDAALLVTLQPGAYTAHVPNGLISSFDGWEYPALALLEVYELP